MKVEPNRKDVGTPVSRLYLGFGLTRDPFTSVIQILAHPGLVFTRGQRATGTQVYPGLGARYTRPFVGRFGAQDAETLKLVSRLLAALALKHDC